MDSSAVSYEDGDTVTDAAKLKSFARIVKGTPYQMNREQLVASEKKFWAGQLSHILRLGQYMDQAFDNPELQRRFPNELGLLKQYRAQSIEQIEQHDGGKFLDRTKFANRGLTYAQGLNWRALAEGKDAFLPPEDAKKASELIKDFIHDVNVGEAQVVNSSFKKLNVTPEFVRAHSLITEVLDYYDTAVNRDDVGSSRKGVVEWIQKLEADGVYKNEPPEDLAFRKAFAEQIQKWNPARKYNHYSKPEDFLKIKTNNFKKDYTEAFKKKSNALITKSANISYKTMYKTANAAAKSAKVKVGGTGAAAAISYLASPETAAEQLVDVLGTVNDFVCDSVGCRTFLKECTTRLKGAAEASPKHFKSITPDITEKQILAHENFEQVCVGDFFRKPLEEQAQIREDENLNLILSVYAPAVRNIRCNATNAIEVEMANDFKDDENTQHYSQKFIYNSAREVHKVERTEVPSKYSKSELTVSGSQVQTLDNCAVGKPCRKFEMKDIRDLKLYLWREESLATPTGRLDGRVPREAVKWARANEKQIMRNASQIHRCCYKEKCKEFFAQRAEKFLKAKDRQNPANLFSPSGIK